MGADGRRQGGFTVSNNIVHVRERLGYFGPESGEFALDTLEIGIQAPESPRDGVAPVKQGPRVAVGDVVHLAIGVVVRCLPSLHRDGKGRSRLISSRSPGWKPITGEYLGKQVLMCLNQDVQPMSPTLFDESSEETQVFMVEPVRTSIGLDGGP